MGNDTYPVKVNEDTWRCLNARKRPGDTFEDVISRMLDESEGSALEPVEN